MLFDGNWEIGAALDSRIIGDNHGPMPVNHPNTGNNSCRGCLIVIHTVGGKSAEFEERCFGIDDGFDAIADEHLSAIFVATDNGFAAAFLHQFKLCSKLRDQFVMAARFAEVSVWVLTSC